MARRLLLKNDGLENIGTAPVGQNFIGYSNSIFSERDSDTNVEITGTGKTYHNKGSILESVGATASIGTETTIYSYKIPKGFYNIGDLFTTGPSVLVVGAINIDCDTVIRGYWSYTEGGLDNFCEQVTFNGESLTSSDIGNGWSHIFNSATSSYSINESGFAINPYSKIVSNVEMVSIVEITRHQWNLGATYSFSYATSSIPDISKDIWFTITAESLGGPEVNTSYVRLGLVKAVRDIRLGQLYGFGGTTNLIYPFSEGLSVVSGGVVNAGVNTVGFDGNPTGYSDMLVTFSQLYTNGSGAGLEIEVKFFNGYPASYKIINRGQGYQYGDQITTNDQGGGSIIIYVNSVN